MHLNSCHTLYIISLYHNNYYNACIVTGTTIILLITKSEQDRHAIKFHSVIFECLHCNPKYSMCFVRVEQSTEG